MREEERYRAIVESIPEGVVMIDSAERITFANQAMATLLGVEHDQLRGRRAHDFVAPASAARFREALARRREGMSERYDVDLIRGDGSACVADVSAAPIFEDGTFAGSIAIMADATERRRLEERLQQTQRLETVGQLAGGIAHDFNNLLAVILNYTHYLHRHLPGDGTLHEEVDQIREAAERASELTHQLLIFSRRDPPVPQTLDVNELVRDTERLLGRTLGEDVTLAIAPCDDPCFVEADRAQLEHALVNLVVNARDAMPGGGSITIASRREADRVVVSVGDEGTGMEPEVVARAFEPFFTTKPKGAGTGLGLATVYGAVTAVGGEARIESEPGAGTTVSLLLPASAAPDGQ